MLVAESDEIAAGFESGAMSASNSVPVDGASNTNTTNNTANNATNGSEGSGPDEESMEDAIADAVKEIVDNNNELDRNDDGDGEDDDDDGGYTMNVHEDIDDQKISALTDEEQYFAVQSALAPDGHAC